jgi:hypothetical protein
MRPSNLVRSLTGHHPAEQSGDKRVLRHQKDVHMYEISLVELSAELSAELPARTLMSCRRVRRARHVAPESGCGSMAGHGSVANANCTSQTISNPQTAVLTGVNGGLIGANRALVAQVGANSNTNSNTQFGTPVNFLG